MVNLPSFRQLEHLVLLADHGHFGHAAKACNVTQSTLSASIKELENTLQAPLVDRTKRRVVLTPLGREIVERARRILNEGKDLVEAARAGSEPLSGILRMGVIATVGPFLLPEVLPRLRRAYPALRLYLVEDLTTRLVEELRAGRLDIVLLALPCEDCRNLETRALFKDPFTVALPTIIRSLPARRSTSNSCALKNCCSSRKGIVCASTRSRRAVWLTGGRFSPSRPPVSTRWYRWWTTGWVSRCCLSWRSTGEFSKGPRLKSYRLPGKRRTGK
jgi:DNA-binding transcriptional LysR family regulator